MVFLFIFVLFLNIVLFIVKRKLCTYFFAAMLFSIQNLLFAGRPKNLYTTPSYIESGSKGKLLVEIDNISFFKNNEFNSTFQSGYTLPGFWFQTRGVYYPLSNLKLEAGFHSIWFWGATHYPAFAYKGVSTWRGEESSKRVHLLPFFRAHVALTENLDFVIGNIYGGENHRLIEPLYNPELNLISDPESGAQMLYRTPWIDLDTWVDWQSYIYELDTRQESFVYGLSTRFKVNAPKSCVHIYIPIQGLIQHKGGEAVLVDKSIQTIMNGAVGAGLKWNVGHHVLKSVNVEFDIAGYIFPKGNTYYKDNGMGSYAELSFRLKNFNVKTSYWSCRNFIPIFGNVFYSSVSTKNEEMVYDRPKMLCMSVDYTRTIGKGFKLGLVAESFYFLSGSMSSLQTGLPQSPAFGANRNISVGVFLRVNPSFLLKQPVMHSAD